MKISPWTIALLTFSVSLPVFAQGGGGGGRGNRQNFGGGNQYNNGGNQYNGTVQQGADVAPNNGVQLGFGGGGRGGRGRNGGGGGGGLGAGAGGMAGGQPGGGGGGRGRRGPFIQSPAPEDYSILNTVSIFSKDRTVYDPTAMDEQARQQETERQLRRNQLPAPTFVGVMKVDSGYVGFIDTPSFNGMSNLVTVKAGSVIDWDGSVVKEVAMDKLVLTGGQNAEIKLGYNLRNEIVQPVYTPPVVVSQDVYNRGNPGSTGNYNNQGFGGNQFGGGGGRGRGRNGGGQYGGGNQFGTGGGGGQFNQNQFNQGTGGQFAAPVPAPTPVDPPLPPGSTDDLAARMAARRAAQLGGG